MTTAIKSTLSCSAAALALVCAACGGPGNAGNSTPGTDIVPVPGGPSVPLLQQVPWVNGAVPLIDAGGNLVTSSLPYYPPLPPMVIADAHATRPVLPNGDDSMLSTVAPPD